MENGQGDQSATSSLRGRDSAQSSELSARSAVDMKISLVAVSLCALCSEGLAAPGGVDVPTSCCFSYTTWKIPLKNVQDYFFTSSLCSKPAVIFITIKGRELCADPEQTWVQDYVNHLKLN